MKRIKREKKQTHIDTEGSWAISYGDMITLLLGFFILFFSLDPADKKESKISQSLLVTMQSLDKEAAKQAARESAQNGYGQQNGKRDGQAEGGYAEGKASGGNSKGQIQGGKSEGESSGGLSDLSGKGQLSAKKIDEGLKANSNIFVIKYGGHAMTNREMQNSFAKDIALLQQVGTKPVVVHGGGPQITNYLEKMTDTAESFRLQSLLKLEKR